MRDKDDKVKNTSFELRQLIIYNFNEREIFEYINVEKITIKNIVKRFKNKNRILFIIQKKSPKELFYEK